VLFGNKASFLILVDLGMVLRIMCVVGDLTFLSWATFVLQCDKAQGTGC
jgi:hypothetical protein